MKVVIISPGKAHDHTVAEGIAGYQKRLDRTLDVSWHMPPAGDKASEAKAILKTIKDTDYVVLLDERGTDIDTPGLAALIDTHLKVGTKRLVFVIGGAFGVDASVRQRAQRVLKLSSLTFPHMLVRLVLVEQLYRAQSILKGAAYHHA